MPRSSAALRRKRRTIVALAIIGALAGVLVSLAFPAAPTATTLVYLEFPDGTDATRLMPTELTILTTRAVARSALLELHSNEDPATLLSKYHGTIAGDGLLRLTATGGDAATARRRADAVAHAFLAYRSQLAQERVDATASALKKQQDRLRQRIEADDAAIKSAANSKAGQGSTYTDLLDDRQQLAAAVQQIDATIQSDRASAQSVAEASRVIDAAYVSPLSTKKAIAKNAVTGLLVGLVLGVGGVLLAAVVTTRLRCRADVAAALQAPVVLSVGRVVPGGWRRFVARLSALGTKEKASHAQLQQAGITSHETNDAERKLTEATNSPGKVLQLLGTETDLAVAKHEDLTTAATQMGSAYNRKQSKEFATPTAPRAAAATKALASATKAAAAADDYAKSARQRLDDFLEIYNPKIKHTVADEQYLQNELLKVADADKKARDAHLKLAAAQELASQAAPEHTSQAAPRSAASAGRAGNTRRRPRRNTRPQAAPGTATNVEQPAIAVRGPAERVANTFAGRLKAMGAGLDDGVPTAERPNADLERVVGHLERTLTLKATSTLVVVSIDSLDVARLAVLTLAHRLRDRGLAVSLVNETQEALPDRGPRGRGRGRHRPCTRRPRPRPGRRAPS